MIEWLPSQNTRGLVAAAADAWRRGLVDVSGGNKRLYYRALRVGTLQLGDADPDGIARLLAGEPVRIEDLTPRYAADRQAWGVSDGLCKPVVPESGALGPRKGASAWAGRHGSSR